MVVNKDGTIKQTIVSFAKRRGLDVTIDYNEDGNRVWIWDLENDCEPLLMYNINQDSTLSFRASLFPKLEDLPAWIDSKQKLNKVFDYVGDMLKAEKM
ncbi:hypothetical protein Hena1_02590 [Erwinia phage Hena1]|uniref:Uncharacterized protein n=1 Tax=Erwinia phage Hena1 TaxID=2678601 RepID=A0A6B9JA29_9CAUD|nr:hypothetical protein HWC84_gp105 [Erwinia phage Hena1]QGZ16409.1 hypothetical protein Hena1_02590 [Erwinia phage Hena1]